MSEATAWYGVDLAQAISRQAKIIVKNGQYALEPLTNAMTKVV